MAWADLASNECPTQGDIVDLLKTGKTTNMINLYGGFLLTIQEEYQFLVHIIPVGTIF